MKCYKVVESRVFEIQREIESKKYTKHFKNHGGLKKAIYISDIQEEQEMLKLLNPIIKSNSVWKIQSLRFLGDFYYSISQFKKAQQYYSILLEEEKNDISKAEINRKIDSIKNE